MSADTASTATTGQSSTGIVSETSSNAASLSAPASFAFDEKRLNACDTPERQELLLFQWLSGLEKDLGSTTKDILKPHQPNLEKLLLKFLGNRDIKPSRPIRELIARTFVLIYHKGDQRSLFDTLAAIQNLLSNKKSDDPAVRVALIHCIGVLTESHGVKVMSLFAETAIILTKSFKSAKDADITTRYEIIKAISSSLRGAGKGATKILLKEFVRFAKLGITDKLPIIRMASAELYTAIYQCTSFLPPTNSVEMEAFVAILVKSLDGSNYTCRRAFCTLISALFEIAQIPENFAKITSKSTLKNEAESTAAAAAEMTILTQQEIFNIISSQFIKASTREARVGVMEATAAFLNRMGPEFVENNHPTILKSIVDTVSNPKNLTARYENTFVFECGTFLMRNVVGKMLTERGQTNCVREIISHYITRWPAVLPTDTAPSDQALTFVLYELSALIADLGQSANECQEQLVQSLFSLLPHPSHTVKVALAWTFRSICVALPENLSTLLNRLVGLLQKDVGLLTPDRPDVVDKIQGYANVVAAVTSVISLHPLYAVYEDAATIFGFSTQLIRAIGSSRNQRVCVCQVQAAWTLIGSLMSLGPNFVKVHLSQLLLLWKAVFPKSQPKDLNANRSELEWSFQFVSRESALAALYSFFVYNAKDLVTSDVAKRIVVCLNNTLNFLSTIPATYGIPLEQPHAGLTQNRLYDRECQLRRRLFQCYSAINPSSVYDISYVQLMKATIDTFALDPDKADRFSGVSGALIKENGHAIESVFSTSLISNYTISVAAESEAEDRGISRVMVQDTDVQGLEDLIDCRVFGSCDNDPHCLYIASSVQTADKETTDGSSKHMIYRPLSAPPGVAMVDAAIELFAFLFPLQTLQTQEIFIESIIKSVTVQAGKVTPARKDAAQINSLISIIGALKYIMVKRGQLASGKVSVAIRDLADPFLRSPNSILRATASEILGRLARVVGTATFVGPLIQSLVDQVVNNRDPESRAGAALALGSIHSFVGGMAAFSHLNTVVGILHSLSCDPHPLVHTWALHSLWLTIESAGLMYGPFVNSTLTLVVKLFMCDSHEISAPAANGSGSDSNAQVGPAFGRILHALVGVIGPELQMSTSLREICFCLYEQLKNNDDPFVVVEAIRCIQNFILFARKYVDIQQLIPFLQVQLSGDYRAQVYMIRKASVTCLYQLIQHDPETVLCATIGNQLEEQLFALLDVETDVMVRDEIKDILMALLRHVAPDHPSRWLDLCKTILSKSSATNIGDPYRQNIGPSIGKAPVSHTTSKSLETQPGVHSVEKGDDDDEDDILDERRQQSMDTTHDAATMSSSQKDKTASHIVNIGRKSSNIVVVLLPRWRTQTFALTCLRTVINVVLATESSEHLDMATARSVRKARTAAGKTSDFLVFRLVDLIRMAFNSSTSNINDLRLGGLFLLHDVLEKYSDSMDPDFEGHMLLEQYQAQIIAALAPAFANESSPEIISTACGVCSFFISTSQNISAMTRPLKLLGGLLDNFSNESYVNSLPSSNAFVMLKISVLKAWAELHSSSVEQPDLVPAIQPYLKLLVKLWLNMLQDYAKLTIDADASDSSVIDTSPGINLYMSATRQITLPFYQQSWVLVIKSLTDLMRDKTPATLKILGDSEEKNDSKQMSILCMLLGLCVEAISGNSNESSNFVLLIRQNSTLAASRQASARAAENMRVAICLGSIKKLLQIYSFENMTLPQSIYLELLSVFNRHVLNSDTVIHTILVDTLEQMIIDSGSTLFQPHGDDVASNIDPFASTTELACNGIIHEKVYKVVLVLFHIIATYIPTLNTQSNSQIRIMSASTPESGAVVVKAFGALLLLAQCSSLLQKDSESLIFLIFSILTTIVSTKNFATDVAPKSIVLIKPLLEKLNNDNHAISSSDRSNAISDCLCATVSNMLDIAALQLKTLEETTARDDSEQLVIQNALLVVILILTIQPASSHYLANQVKLVELLNLMLNGSNIQIALLATQYIRTLILLSCRANDLDTKIGASHLRLLLPISARYIYLLGFNLAHGTDVEKLCVVEESMKTLMLLATNTVNEHHKFTALAILMPLYLRSMTDMVAPDIPPSFASTASKSIHIFAAKTLLQCASQCQSQFKLVLQTLEDEQKAKLEWSLKSMMAAQANNVMGGLGASDARQSGSDYSQNVSAAPKIQLKNFASFG
ncbi:hypothetical protein BDV3_003842 [Batrachochytrium dendrobatidis]